MVRSSLDQLQSTLSVIPPILMSDLVYQLSTSKLLDLCWGLTNHSTTCTINLYPRGTPCNVCNEIIGGKVHTFASKSRLLLTQPALCAPSFGLCLPQLTHASTPIADHTHPLLLVVRPHLPLACPPQAPLLSSSSSLLQAWEPYFAVVADASSLVVSHASIPIPCVYLSLRENELMCKHGSWKIREQCSASTAVQSCACSTCNGNLI